MNDAYGRRIDYLRISITDRCNERCTYCMPAGYRGFREKPDLLRLPEVVAIAHAAAKLGVRKIRLTGGEPLVRPDAVEIVAACAAHSGVEVALSTNGTRLAALAEPLRAAGLHSINISLDALDPSLYRRITGGDVSHVLAGIDAAVSNFERVKLNCVLMRGVNEGELWPLVRFAAERRLVLRFIELMPLTHREVLNQSQFLPVQEAMQQLALHDELAPDEGVEMGWGPARYYRLARCGARVGFIAALTNPHFCERCNKMRITAEGSLRPCLGDHGEIDLRPALRPEVEQERLQALLLDALRGKPLQHHFRDSYVPLRPMTAIGG